MTGTIDARLTELGLVIPTGAAPVANYVPAVEVGGMLYISGQLPMAEGRVVSTGRLGADLDVAAGNQAAQLCAVNILSQAKAALGDLDRVARVIKLTGFVASTPDFTDQPKVVNGASDLMVAVFGEAGRHSRSAVGVAALPLGASVEVEAILAIA